MTSSIGVKIGYTISFCLFFMAMHFWLSGNKLRFSIADIYILISLSLVIFFGRKIKKLMEWE